ncbi:MAG: VOC family protein [Acidobacteriaceae bacterium]|nr:VOC family protein [Acidobacteriaceae bacterium]
MKATEPCPKGFHTVTPALHVRNARQAIDFYKKALGAEEAVCMTSPDGKIGHAELRIGDSMIFLSDENPAFGNKSPQSLGGTTGGLYLYIEDVDKGFQRALDAGGQQQMPVTDMFWGDRMGSFVDPFGHHWTLATHVRDVSIEEMKEGEKKFYAQMAQQAQKKSA